MAAFLMAMALAASAPDYRDPAAWLCRPGRSDACTLDQDATVVATGGVGAVERFRPAAAPKFDCFYVYPTVSTDPTPNSDLSIDEAERRVAQIQAARFRRHCRVFAPMYRQVTLVALREAMTTGKPQGDRAMAYADVKRAWDDYLANDNKGRGVVLIGHSQGSGVLKQLIASEIDGKPIARRMIAAYLTGTNVAVPLGKDMGGDFTATPLCRSASQTGCVVSYVSFRADAPPPKGSRFGVASGAPAACTNPAALGGGKATSHPVLPATSAGIAGQAQGSWASDGKPVTTPFVSLPGLFTTECVARDGFGYLAVTTNADPADARTDTVAGDVVVGGTILKDWGLHLIDMPVVMDDLVALSDTQARAWAAKR